MAVDKTIVITDEIVDDILEDWVSRDKRTFTHTRKSGKLEWEHSLEEGSPYSSYYLDCPSTSDLIKRSYSLATDMIISMNIPFKVKVVIHNSHESYTDSKVVKVSSIMLEDTSLTIGERIDAFLGTTIHEGCHLLYTNFEKLKSGIPNKIIGSIFNIIEDERIERLLGDLKPGFSRFIEKVKSYWFDQFYLDFTVKKLEKRDLNDFEKIMNLFLGFVRYPVYIDEKDVVTYAHYLIEFKKVISNFPITTYDAIVCAFKIFDIIKEFYSDKLDEERRDCDGEGDGGTSKPSEKEIIEAIAGDSKEIIKALEKVVSDKLDEEKIASEVKKDKGLLGDICEGKVELGSSKEIIFSHAKSDEESYKESLARVKRYVPAISKVIRCHGKEYKYIHRSMRSGLLDTNKLAEAVQGVPTIYIREGEVRTDSVCVGVLIDESGSMRGSKILAAKDSAILLNEALGSLPKVELFIYGHSGDIRHSGCTEVTVYRENKFSPKYSLGSVRARMQNRDGIAILETASRIRKQTKNHVLLFVLSDGEPAADGYGGDSAIKHTRECVKKVEAMNFTVIQVCIDTGYDPASMFKHWVILNDMSRLALDLGRTIKKSAVSASKVHVI